VTGRGAAKGQKMMVEGKKWTQTHPAKATPRGKAGGEISLWRVGALGALFHQRGEMPNSPRPSGFFLGKGSSPKRSVGGLSCPRIKKRGRIGSTAGQVVGAGCRVYKFLADYVNKQ